MERIWERVAAPGNVHELVSIANFCYNEKVLDFAFELLDSPTLLIQKFTTPGITRVCWSISGSKGTTYICSSTYCPCPQYYEANRLSATNIQCKHLVAIEIGTVLDIVIENQVTDSIFAKLLLGDNFTELVERDKTVS